MTVELGLRSSLALIKEPQPGKEMPRIPSDMCTFPQSLRKAIEIMQKDPQMSGWTRPSEWKRENESWTEECQGVCTDGTHWYLVSNKVGWGLSSEQRSIYKFNINLELLAEYHIGDKYGEHLGDPDCHSGVLYVPVEPTIGVALVDMAFTGDQFVKLKGKNGGAPPQTHMSWCAIHPWNGYLYSSDFDAVGVLHAYDPNDGFRNVPAAAIRLRKLTDRVQGACFSANGHVYLSSDSSYDIRAFSVINGAFLGSATIQVDAGDGEEVQGLCYWPITVGGIPVQLHVILLDNDDLNHDDIFLKHYAAPVAGSV